VTDIHEGEIRRAHSALGTTQGVITQRRTLYSAAIELVTGDSHTSDDILDNPVVRSHIGQVLAGRERLEPSRCRPTVELVDPAVQAGIPVASSSEAGDALAAALARVAAGMTGGDDRPTLVTPGNSKDFGHALSIVRDGIALASLVAPLLADDLLPHVGLIAIVKHADRLGSASTRDFPGLVVLPVPERAVEAAEGLIHEGAHQKFFDMAVTMELLGPEQAECPPFFPPWAEPGALGWPLEQTFAAWHAYSCLTAFEEGLRRYPDVSLVPHSLLPFARQRAELIGTWLLDHSAFLGADARVLLAELSGHTPAEGYKSNALDLTDVWESADVVRHCGDKVLVGVRGDPPAMFWFAAEDLPTRLEAFP
jgi:hypothetical protein